MFLASALTNLFFRSIDSHGNFAAHFTVNLHHHQHSVFNHRGFIRNRPRCIIDIAFAFQLLPQGKAGMRGERVQHTHDCQQRFTH
ncbi:hypothetical protein D3C76_1694410 [compost metagenome]